MLGDHQFPNWSECGESGGLQSIGHLWHDVNMKNDQAGYSMECLECALVSLNEGLDHLIRHCLVYDDREGAAFFNEIGQHMAEYLFSRMIAPARNCHGPMTPGQPF